MEKDTLVELAFQAQTVLNDTHGENCSCGMSNADLVQVEAANVVERLEQADIAIEEENFWLGTLAQALETLNMVDRALLMTPEDDGPYRNVVKFTVEVCASTIVACATQLLYPETAEVLKGRKEAIRERVQRNEPPLLGGLGGIAEAV